MILVSELIGKQLICLNTAEIVGTVSNVVFSEKLDSAKLLRIYNDDDIDSEIKYVELKKVKNISFDACVILDNNSIIEKWNAVEHGVNPINYNCYNQDGKFLGIVKDLELDGCKVNNICLNESKFPPSKLLSYSDKLLIFNDSNSVIKLNKVKKTTVPKPDSAKIQTVQVHSITTSEPEVNAPAVANEPQNDKGTINIVKTGRENIVVPSKVQPANTQVSRSPISEDKQNPNPYKFLIGKRLRRAIKSEGGATIANENDTISDEIINTAREHGRLIQLALYAE